MRLSSGAVLGGRYRLGQPLGEGGMGEVWSATHLVTGRALAIKRLLRPSQQRALDEARARFLLEARSACAVAHPNVVEVLDFVEAADELPFIVMELLHGETLAQKLSREGTQSLQETAAIALPVASAVGSAHARGIVHRDLKPSNIFSSSSHGARPVVKVLDFGIAKWLIPELGSGAVHTQTGSSLGTPSYMAPEQAMAARSVDHRADIWSLGVILYECLSGVRPVEGDNPAQVAVRLLSSGIIPIERLVPELPAELAQLIGRMLTREPSRRPRDLGEVFAALRPYSDVDAPAFSAPACDLFRSEPEHSLVAAPPEAAPAAPVTGLSVASALERPRPVRGAKLGASLALAAAGGFLLLGLQRRAAQAPAAPPPPREAPLRAQAPLEPQSPLPPSSAAPAPSATPQPAARRAARSASKGSRGARLAVAPAPPVSAAGAARTGPATAEPEAAQQPASGNPLPRGAACERSTACASRLCVAFRCK